MAKRLIFSIAWTHLRQRPRQTILASLGVTFGISMYVFMISFMGGLNKFMDDLTVENTPDVRIYYEAKTDRPSILSRLWPGHSVIIHHQKPKKEKRNLRSGLQMASRIRQLPDVKVVAPQLSTQVFFSYGTQELAAALDGIYPKEEEEIYTLGHKIIEGKLIDLVSGENVVILGVGIAKKLDLHVGDRVNVTAPTGNRLRLKVVALLNTGIKQMDDSRAYTSLATAQKLLGEDNAYITSISLRLKDREKAPILAKELERQYGYRAEDWVTANAAFETGSSIRNIISYSVSITLLIVAGFGIYNILSMSIQEKMRDIAILKAMGFNGKDVLTIFLTEALTIGVLGGTLGLLLGFTLSFVVSNIPFNVGGMFALKTFPVNFYASTYIMAFLFGLLTTGLSGLLPSRKAGKMDPVAILRG